MGRARTDTPLYAWVLRLRHIHPGAVLCFVLFEGTTALAGLLAFAELVSWWLVPVLPLAVAAMVKLNDVVVGAFTTVPTTATAPTGGLRPDPPSPQPVGGDLVDAVAPRGRHAADTCEWPRLATDVQPPARDGHLEPEDDRGAVYGSPKPPDDDETPAVGCARCPGTGESQSYVGTRRSPFASRVGGLFNGRLPRLVHGEDQDPGHRNGLNQRPFSD